MRAIVVNTGTEILLGDVLNTHLTFIAQEVFLSACGSKSSSRCRTVWRFATCSRSIFKNSEIIFVTGGLGPTTDDIYP